MAWSHGFLLPGSDLQSLRLYRIPAMLPYWQHVRVHRKSEYKQTIASVYLCVHINVYIYHSCVHVHGVILRKSMAPHCNLSGFCWPRLHVMSKLYASFIVELFRVWLSVQVPGQQPTYDLLLLTVECVCVYLIVHVLSNACYMKVYAP